jgi:NAD(P)-dependent dehydrogenase (short-subunit alcohol dehydrogenase family)
VELTISLKGKVAIVTGAGGGLGRQHALALAAYGAKVVVNDLGGTLDGIGQSASAADLVVAEIKAAGGEAIANTASVTDWPAVVAMVETTLSTWGRIDILVNNAGILRDKSFSKMAIDDFRLVMEVHVMGAVNCCKAVWETMRSQNFGRIIMTTSSSGLFGNFGQSNYSAAKMALVGLMQTLSIEGAKNNIRVNCLAPTAATRMTEGILSTAMLEALKPEVVSPAVVFMSSDAAPNRRIICAGAGSFEVANITLTQGCKIGSGPNAADELAERFEEVCDRSGEIVPQSGAEQGITELKNIAG